jgi:hypothetical protein
MNKLPLILLLLISVLFQQCSEEDAATATRTRTRIAFALDEKTSAAIPDGSSILISLVTPDGQEIYSDHSLKLSAKNGVLVSETLEVNGKDLELVELLVMHDDEVIFASPKAGSDMAREVSVPLSQKFTAGTTELAIAVEVVNAKNANPEKFGYASFKKKAKNTFQIQTYFYYQGVKTPFSCYVQIKDADTAYYYYMDAGINTLTFNGDPHGTYTLTTYRPGFYRKSMPFNLKELKGKNNLIDVLMEETNPADIVEMTPHDYNADFTLGMVGVGCIYTSFGNGSAMYGDFPSNPNIIPPPDTSYMNFSTELTAYDDIIQVSGDLDQVVSMEINTGFAFLDISRLPNLSIFELNNSTTEALNFSANPKLRSFSLTNAAVIDFQLSENAELSQVHLQNVWTGGDNLVGEIYTNSVTHNITGGSINISGVSLSAESLGKLNELESNYNWTVTIAGS